MKTLAVPRFAPRPFGSNSGSQASRHRTRPPAWVLTCVIASFVTFLCGIQTRAADAAWNVNAAGTWLTDGNWDPAAAPGSTSDTANPDTATFGPVITTASIVTVDANRNILGINFAGNSSAYTLSGGNLLLSGGGLIQTSGSGSGHTDTISSPIAIQGDGGSATFTAGSSTATRILSIGAVTAVATGVNVTTLVLNGTNTGGNTVSGLIGDGAGGGKLALVKSGPGAWKLTNTASTYTGATTINDGILNATTLAAVNTPSSIGSGSVAGSASDIVFGGGSLLHDAANVATTTRLFTIGNSNGLSATLDSSASAAANIINFSDTGAIAFGGSGARTLTLTGSNTGANNLSPVLGNGPGGATSLHKTGTGSWTISGANTYTGSTGISEGTLRISNTSTFTNTSAVNLSGSGRLDLNLADQSLAKLATPVGTGVVAGTTLRFSQAQTAAGTGPGTIFGRVELNLTNVNPNYTLDFGSGSTLTTLGAFTYNSPVTLSGNAAIESNATTANVFTGGAGMTISASTPGTKVLGLTGANTGANTIGGVISDGSGTLGITKSGTGTWVLSGSNTYHGATTLGEGTLQANNANALGGGDITFAGGTLQFTTASAGQDWATRIKNSTSPIRFDTNAQNVSFTGTIAATNNGGLIKLGAGTLTLSEANAYTGPTSVTAGALSTTKATALPGYDSPGQVAFSGGTIAVQFGAGLWDTTEVNALLSNATKTSGALGIDTSTGDLTQWTAFTATSFGPLGLTKLGPDKLTLNQANSYTGTTSIDQGTLAPTANQNLAGGLNFGSVPGTTTTGSLDLTSASATFAGAMVVNTNSTTANTIAIDAGKSLTVNHNVTIGYAAATTSTSKLTLTGSGSFTVSNSGGEFRVGGNLATGHNNNATLDMSGLTTFSADLGTTGKFIVGDNYTTGSTGNATSTLLLAADSTITAASLNVEHAGSTASATMVLKLGSGTNTINVDTLNVGPGATNMRASGTMDFNLSTGSLKMRGSDTSGKTATLNVGYTLTSSSLTTTASVNLNGHDVDLLLGNLNIGRRSGGTAGTNATFQMNQGTLVVDGVTIGNRSATGSGNPTGNFTIGGGTVTINTGMTLGTATAAGTANANFSVTGGVVTFGAGSTGIAKGSLTGTVVSSITVNGGTLDLGGKGIGAAGAGAIDTLTLSSGTLRNVAEINGGGEITKGTAGTLVLEGTNSYTGPTTVALGTLLVNGNTSGSAFHVNPDAILGGTGTTGPVTAAGTIAPGTSVGTLTSGNTTLTGTYTCEIDGSSADKWIAATLDITGATLVFSVINTPTAPSYTIATYTPGSLTGTFSSSTVPAGYSLNYATAGQIKLVSGSPIPDYDTWMGHYPSITGADKLPGADPDKDGLTNQEEYAFGLIPNNGASVSPIIVHLNKTTGTFTYIRRNPSLTGLASYKVWTSTDLTLGGWTLDAGGQVPTDVGENQNVVVTLTAAKPLTAPRLFVRVTAE